MESIYLKLINEELVYITKPKYNKLISYGNFFDTNFVYSLVWIYKYYFEQSVLLFLPKIVNIHESLELFNKKVGDFLLTQEEITHCSLETIELKMPKIVIYAHADFLFNDLCILNKRRINTHLKNCKSKVHVLSYSSLKLLDIPAFDLFDYHKIASPKFEFQYIDLLDPENNYMDSFVDFIHENKNKRIYISIPSTLFIELEKKLKEKVDVSRKETNNIVMSTSKVIQKSFLKERYDIYIFITQPFEYPLDLLYYLKEVYPGAEVYIDSSQIKRVANALRQINYCLQPERITVKDSKEYPSYDELVQDLENPEIAVIVTEQYYCFVAPKTIQSMDLSQLTKKQYDLIRSFVKLKLSNQIDLEVSTCQLSAPCSPKDRSKKLNSLSNKISSYDYRCDVTCEIFRDYTIGVVVWNETFSNRKSLTVQKNNIFVYQTTSGTWKYTSVN
jgi:hypothetical protein